LIHADDFLFHGIVKGLEAMVLKAEYRMPIRSLEVVKKLVWFRV
jgi:uncharacterized membrane protein